MAFRVLEPGLYLTDRELYQMTKMRDEFAPGTKESNTSDYTPDFQYVRKDGGHTYARGHRLEF